MQAHHAARGGPYISMTHDEAQALAAAVTEALAAMQGAVRVAAGIGALSRALPIVTHVVTLDTFLATLKQAHDL